MSTITKQWLQQKISDMEAARDEIPFGLDEDDSNTLAALRIALASLEAEPAIHRWRRVTSEPYGPYPWHYGDFIGFSKPVDGIEDEYFYSAPPEPANAEPVAWLWSHRKHPSEVSLVKPEDDERAEGAHWSGWSCQALYAAQPASAAMKDHQIRELVNELRDIAVEYHGTQQLRERIARTIRAAMLQGADGNSPVIPDGWVACVERMPSAVEQVLAYRPDAPESNDPLIKMATYVGGSAHGHGFDCYCKPTHWMPLPAAPQQEVKP